jgi:trk system potassium uptake protein TrkA
MAGKSFAVIGLGQFGFAITKTLVELGQEVLAIDRSVESIHKIETLTTTAFVAECTNAEALKDVGVHNVDVAIVAFGDNIHDTILTTAILSELEVKKIIVRLDSPEYEKLLSKLGATDFIRPTTDAGRNLAIRLAGSSFTDYFSLGKSFGVSTLTIPVGFKPDTLIKLAWRNKYDVNIILVQKTSMVDVEGESIPAATLAKGDEVLHPGDTIFAVGSNDKLLRFANMLKKSV